MFMMDQHAKEGDKGPSLALEDGYNMHEACSRYHHEWHVALFQKIMDGKCAEDVYQLWLGFQKELNEAFSLHQVKQVSCTSPC